MWANCTRCSGRQVTLAPTSSSRIGERPGLGSGSASAGRYTPRSRRRLNSAAASAGPVEPPDTNAWARPSATARVAWTIDASGVVRTAFAGSAFLAIETGASTTSTPAGTAPISLAGPEQQDPDALRGRASSARRDLARAEVGPARIDGDGDHAGRPQAIRSSRSGTMTSRPL